MRNCVIMAVIFALTTAFATAADGVADLGCADEHVRVQTAARLLEGGAASVPDLLKGMDDDNPTVAKMASQTLFKMVQAAAGSPKAAPLAEALSKQMAGHGVNVRREVCDLLGYLGANEQAVAALTASLADKELQEQARRALVRSSAPAATTALVERLGTADAEFQAAILKGLGEKGDPAAAAAVRKLIVAENEAVRRVAWETLAKLADTQSVEVFAQAVKDKKDARIGVLLLDYAETLLDAGKLAEADAVLKLRNEVGPLDTLDTCRVLRAHGRLGTLESIAMILPALQSENPKIRGAAFEAAVILPGTEVTRQLTQQMIAAKGQAKLDLLHLLGKRGSQLDDRTVMMMYMAILDKDDAVKIAAIEAMQEAGVTSTVPTLLNLVRGPAGPVRDAADQALAQTPGEHINKQIIDSLGNSTPVGRARLLEVLGLRSGPEVPAVAIRYTNDTDAGVRAAAFGCLARAASEDAYETILAGFDLPAGPDRDAAERAMKALGGDLITAKLLAGYFDSPDTRKPSLLRVLSYRKLEAIDALLIAESKSPDEATRAAAVEGLARRAKPSMAEPLLEAIKTGPVPIADVALTGYCNIATNIEKVDKPAANRMCVEALKLAATDAQRKTVLSTIGGMRNAADPAVIDAVAALMSEGAVQAEAADAIIEIATRLSETDKDRAAILLKKVVEGCKDPAVSQKARKLLDKLNSK